MKKYQTIMPILLPAVLVVSCVYMVQGRIQTKEQHESYIASAEDYAKNGIVADAVAAYRAALQINPSPQTYLAVGQLYLDQKFDREADRWYEEMLKQYPDSAVTYEFGVRAKLARDNRKEAFAVYDAMKERNLQSDSVEQLMQDIWYSFDLVGDYDEVYAFSPSGLAPVKADDKWSYVDVRGSKSLQNGYREVGAFGEIAPVVDREGEAYFIDKQGNKKLTASYFLEKDPEFGEIVRFGPLADGLVPAYNGEVWNYYDANTYQKKFGGYKQATPVANGVGAVSKDGQLWAIIDRDGNELTDFEYQAILTDKSGVAARADAVIAQKNGMYLLLNKQGKQIGEKEYDSACPFYDNSFAAMEKDGRWIFVNAAGEEKELGEFEEAKSFSAGVAAAKKNGKWGYIDQNGKWIIEPQFYDADAFRSEGVAFVKTDENKWQLLILDRFNH